MSLSKKMAKMSLGNKPVSREITVGEYLTESNKNSIETREITSLFPGISYVIDCGGKTGWKIEVTNKNKLDANGKLVTVCYDLYEEDCGKDQYCFFVKHKTIPDKLVKYNVYFFI